MKNCYNPRMYLSMLRDGINMQCLASAIFLFFACISPIVTFGGLMGQKTGGHMVSISHCWIYITCSFVYLCGQPTGVSWSCHDTVAASSYVDRSLMQLRRSGTRFRTLLGTQR